MKRILLLWVFVMTGIAIYRLISPTDSPHIVSAAQEGNNEVITTPAMPTKMEWSTEELDWLEKNGLKDHALVLDQQQGKVLREIILISMRDEFFEKAILDSIARHYPDINPEQLLSLPDIHSIKPIPGSIE